MIANPRADYSAWLAEQKEWFLSMVNKIQPKEYKALCDDWNKHMGPIISIDKWDKIKQKWNGKAGE